MVLWTTSPGLLDNFIQMKSDKSLFLFSGINKNIIIDFSSNHWNNKTHGWRCKLRYSHL